MEPKQEFKISVNDKEETKKENMLVIEESEKVLFNSSTKVEAFEHQKEGAEFFSQKIDLAVVMNTESERVISPINRMTPSDVTSEFNLGDNLEENLHRKNIRHRNS